MAKNGASKRATTASAQGLAPTSPPLTPARSKSLKSVGGCRLELIRLYDLVKTGRIDPTVGGRCAYILNSLITSVRDHQFDQRLAELEARLDQKAKPNGRARSEVHP
jgi:hypothetical protein